MSFTHSYISNEKPEYDLAHRYSPDDDDPKKTLLSYDYAHQDEFENLKKWINENILVDKSIEKIDRADSNVLIKAKNGQYHGLELLSSGDREFINYYYAALSKST